MNEEKKPEEAASAPKGESPKPDPELPAPGEEETKKEEPVGVET